MFYIIRILLNTDPLNIYAFSRKGICGVDLEYVRSAQDGDNVEGKPENIHMYRKWLDTTHCVEVTDRDETYYQSVTYKAKRDFEKSDFWVQLVGNLERYNQEYLLETGYPLFIPHFKPEVFIKPFQSFFLKTYRKNVLENESWPNEPRGGWILPSNWFSRIDDIIRTLLVVKYFDGVEFVISRIHSLCQQHNLKDQFSLEAREEGYYAAHLYVEQCFEIPGIKWDTESVTFPIEIQITTQLQEVIRKLLHKYYERRRKLIREPAEKWQWDYKSDEFCANYLGHILHYVEGMIMEVRERQEEKIV